MEKKKNPMLGRLCIFGATLLWGTSFVIMKNTLDSIDPLWLLTIRFFIAAVVLFLVGAKDWKRMSRATLRGGAAMGFVLAICYLTQTYGLVYTTPGKNAFLTAAYCVITPFLYWLYKHRRPDRYNVIAGILCICGVGLISLEKGFTIGLGDGLTLVAGLGFAVHIIVIDESVSGQSSILINAVQFVTAGVITLVLALLFGKAPQNLPTSAVVSILYLALGCTAASFLLQTIGQKHTPPSQAAILLTLESVIGAILSVVFYHEVLTPRLFAGFVVMFLSIIVSETKLSFLKRKKTV